MSFFRPALRKVFKPHVVMGPDGRWRVYRSAWKAQFPESAAHIAAPTIRQLAASIDRDYFGWRFGGKPRRKYRRGGYLPAPPPPPDHQ